MRSDVGDSENLIQTMRNIDDSNAALAQAPERGEEALDVSLGQRRGRLIENEDVGLDSERPADGDERALGGRQRRDRRIGVEIDAHDRKRVRGGLAHAPPRHQAQGRSRIAGLNGDILCDRHPLHETEILMDEGDRQRPRRRTRRPSRKRNLTLVGLVYAGHDLDEGRLARAILAEQGVDFSALHVEVDMIERKRRGESLDDTGHSEKRRQALPTGFDAFHDRSFRTFSRPGERRPPGLRRRGYLTSQTSR
jgi:hypothetical protein